MKMLSLNDIMLPLLQTTLSLLFHYWWLILLLAIGAILVAVFENEIRIAAAIIAMLWFMVQVYGADRVATSAALLVAVPMLAALAAVLAVAAINRLKKPQAVIVRSNGRAAGRREE